MPVEPTPVASGAPLRGRAQGPRARAGRSSTWRPGRGSSAPDTPDGVITAVRRLAPVAATLRAVPRQARPAAAARRSSSAACASSTRTRPRPTQRVAAGEHVVVTTPTASGKTLCYNLPVLDAMLKDSAARALYLFPTKALAQDQMAELHELTALVSAAGGDDIGVHTYDGDTPADARKTIRARAHIALTNPDMLHAGILPHHPRWAKLFENLQVRGDRRAARLPRRLRQPSVQRAAAAAAHLPALRVEPAVHLLVGHDRQPASSWPSGWPSGRSRTSPRAARRAAKSSSCSSTRRW